MTADVGASPSAAAPTSKPARPRPHLLGGHASSLSPAALCRPGFRLSPPGLFLSSGALLVFSGLVSVSSCPVSVSLGSARLLLSYFLSPDVPLSSTVFFLPPEKEWKSEEGVGVEKKGRGGGAGGRDGEQERKRETGVESLYIIHSDLIWHEM